ncbi:DUF6701 domain-containing protein [Shewanella sp. Isolate11]|uniref:DUF6701 domain-containing protein n=1 Tax=Shewanella sp. Isolate11 TaxID=2908530 RepID=UPI001EFD4DAB|nr:DUF6701 domain-containing protein [Shewanella sp. Isolate11]MCG9695489.1 MSHA biogenesis protein MshQ [Shewanella sp. Isolate11]
MLLIAILFPGYLYALPQCSGVFTDPPSGNVPKPDEKLVPPDDIGPKLGDLSCNNKGCNRSDYFTPGDYNFRDGSFSHNRFIDTNGTTTRLYFDNLELNNSSLNQYGKAEDLFIYVRGTFTLSGHNYINGIIYVAGDMDIKPQTSIDGAFAAGGELDIYSNTSIDIDLSVIENADLNDICSKEQLGEDHFRLELTSGALTCMAKTIQLRSCANDDCSTESNTAASVVLTKGGVKYSDVSFVGHTQTSVWHPSGGTVLLGLGGVAPALPYRCYIDGVLVANSQCLLTYEDTGLYFDVPNTTSSKTSSNFSLFAVTKDTQTQQCQPLFSNQTQAINFNFDYLRPSVVNNAASLAVTSVNAPSVSTQIDAGTSQSLNVQFDANGVATLNVNYPEAGVVSVSGEFLYSVALPDGSSETLSLTHSDNFTAAPAGFHFANVSTNPRCDSSDPFDANCQVLAKAGEGFAMQIIAAGWQSDSDSDFSDNMALQNFQHSNLSMQSQVAQPSTGSSGSLGVSSSGFSLASGEMAQQISNQSWDEVGTMTVQLANDVSYEGMTISKANSSSERFGRFTPAYLKVIGNVPEITPSCGSFTYLDQPFSFTAGAEPQLTVLGFNAANSETQNYQIGDWWRYKHQTAAEQNQWLERQYQDVTSLATIVDGAETGVSGTVVYQASPNSAELIGAEVQYQRSTDPLAPFDAKFDLVLSVNDVSDEDGVCYQADAVGSCLSYRFDNIGESQSMPLRYGRMLLDNGYGPESESLRLPIEAQYVASLTTSGEAVWQTNIEDYCSVYQTPSSSDAGETAISGLYMSLPVSIASLSAYNDSRLTSQSGIVTGGLGYLFFSVPNSAGEVPLKQHVQPWLKWFWNFDAATPSTLYDPRATAYFGTYRGHDKVIFWREVN